MFQSVKSIIFILIFQIEIYREKALDQIIVLVLPTYSFLLQKYEKNHTVYRFQLFKNKAKDIFQYFITLNTSNNQPFERLKINKKNVNSAS